MFIRIQNYNDITSISNKIISTHLITSYKNSYKIKDNKLINIYFKEIPWYLYTVLQQ